MTNFAEAQAIISLTCTCDGTHKLVFSGVVGVLRVLDGVESVTNRSESQPNNGIISPLQTLTARLALTMKRPPVTGWLFWSLALAATTTVSATLGAAVALLGPLSQQLFQHQSRSPHDLWRSASLYRLSRPIGILVMGIDRVDDVSEDSSTRMNGRSDTMLLLRIDPKNNSVKVLSIPRDTRVESRELSVKKIDRANAVGGADLAAKVVSNTLNDVAIDRYVRVTADGFRELIDLVGGVEVFVPQKMQYADKDGRLNIDRSQGWQTLNGEQAIQFARSSKNYKDDISRVQRQQLLLKGLRERLSSPTVLPNLPQTIRVMQRYIDTNISLEEMLAIANFAANLDRSNVNMAILPGRFNDSGKYASSYWIVDRTGQDRIVRDYFGIKSKKIAADAKPSTKTIRIAIQNASGKPDLIPRVTEYLKSLGLRNIYSVEDWPSTERVTQIIVQKGDSEAAEKLKTMLGLGIIEAASTGDIESDLTLRVGKDWPNSGAIF